MRVRVRVRERVRERERDRERERVREREREVWRALVAPHSLYQTLCFALSHSWSHALLLAEQEGQEENLEAIKVIPKAIPVHIVEKVIVEQIVDVPPPPLMEETAKDGQIIPQELVQNRTAEQKVDIPMPAQGGNRENRTDHSTGACAESHGGADR